MNIFSLFSNYSNRLLLPNCQYQIPQFNNLLYGKIFSLVVSKERQKIFFPAIHDFICHYHFYPLWFFLPRYIAVVVQVEMKVANQYQVILRHLTFKGSLELVAVIRIPPSNLEVMTIFRSPKKTPLAFLHNMPNQILCYKKRSCQNQAKHFMSACSVIQTIRLNDTVFIYL